MEDFIQILAQGGFAVAVAAYLLVRMESRLEALTRALQDLQVVLARLEVNR